VLAGQKKIRQTLERIGSKEELRPPPLPSSILESISPWALSPGDRLRSSPWGFARLDLFRHLIRSLTLLRNWRQAGLATPVLVLTARSSWHDNVRGIDGGADDYVAKPFRIEEVLARLRALIRRASGHVTPELRADHDYRFPPAYTRSRSSVRSC
jgi:DNA-binding response OmpR family regulator